MAWDESEFCGKPVMIGDKTIDEMSLAMKKISIDYIERFDRKPTIAEALYAINIVLLAGAAEYFSDPDLVKKMQISFRE